MHKFLQHYRYYRSLSLCYWKNWFCCMENFK